MVHHQANQHIYCGILRRDKDAEIIFEEITSENTPNLMKVMNINIQQVKKTQNKLRDLLLDIL